MRFICQLIVCLVLWLFTLSPAFAGSHLMLCRQSLVPLSERILKEADITEYRTRDGVFRQGDIVDFYLKPTLGDRPSLTSSVSVGQSAIFVGAFEVKSKLLLIFDTGGGRVKSIPVSKVDRILPSTANLKPSKGTPLEKVLMVSKSTYFVTSQIFLPSVLGSVPTLTAVLVSAYSGMEALNFVWELSQEQTLVATGSGALMLAAASTENGRSNIKSMGSLALKGVWYAGKVAGHILKFSLKAPFMPGKIWKSLKLIFGASSLRFVDRLTQKTADSPLAERIEISEEAEGVRMIAIPAKDSKDPEAFVARSRQLFESGLSVKSYMGEIGAPFPAGGYKPTIWFLENRSVLFSGPIALTAWSTIVMTPIKAGVVESLKARLTGEKSTGAERRPPLHLSLVSN